jgi:hypothetical protein
MTLENAVSSENKYPNLDGLDISDEAVLRRFDRGLANKLLNDSFNEKKPYGKVAVLLEGFMPIEQLAVMIEGAGFLPRKKVEEADYFKDKILEVGERIAGMPKVYEQDEKYDEAIVYLHYFKGGSDWYITEKDSEPQQLQAFGYVVLNGDEVNAEQGYISLVELSGLGVELDLHFTPRTLREVKAEREQAEERRQGATR